MSAPFEIATASEEPVGLVFSGTLFDWLEKVVRDNPPPPDVTGPQRFGHLEEHELEALLPGAPSMLAAELRAALDWKQRKREEQHGDDS